MSSDADRPSVETAVELQKELGLGDVHIVWLDETGFTIAHTDKERRQEIRNLSSCPLHNWLHEQDDMPVAKRGWYMARKYEPDAYSEDLGFSPWGFEAIIA